MSTLLTPCDSVCGIKASAADKEFICSHPSLPLMSFSRLVFHVPFWSTQWLFRNPWGAHRHSRFLSAFISKVKQKLQRVAEEDVDGGGQGEGDDHRTTPELPKGWHQNHSFHHWYFLTRVHGFPTHICCIMHEVHFVKIMNSIDAA